ncbi:MAG: DUF447 domain-containing protein [Rubripirellula sp.]
MILEAIVTSIDLNGTVNLAPMGPVVADDFGEQKTPEKLVLKPFRSSLTYQNLMATGKAVVHVTDDVSLIARTAVGKLSTSEIAGLVKQWEDSEWWRLRSCHRWMAVQVEAVSEGQPRVEMDCRVVHSEIEKPFFGFNRAKFAVIEAAILATRTHLLSADQIQEELDRLQPLIDKTGGQTERTAFGFLRKAIDERIANH